MSSCVVLQVGQCGNQIGREFWKFVENDTTYFPSDIWTHHDGYFRSVNVDTEPKVIGRLIAEGRQLTGASRGFRPGNAISGRSGRGSNWAMGYNSNRGAGGRENVIERTTESLRHEIERCDSFQGVVLMHSLAGGTGSGVGSRLAEIVRDEISPGFLISCAVSAFSTGESPTQHYNTTLALASLTHSADCLFVIDNEDVLQTLERRSKSVDTSISLSQMNRQVAASLAGIFLPVDSATSGLSRSIGSEPCDAVRLLTPMPTLKHVTLDSTGDDGRRGASWDELTSRLFPPGWSVLSSDVCIAAPPSILSCLVVARGVTDLSFVAASQRIEERVRRRCVAWNPFPFEFWTSSACNSFGQKRPTKSLTTLQSCSSLTMASNEASQSSTRLDRLLVAARTKFDAKAFLHWYEKYECTKDDFNEAFEIISATIDEYRQAVS